MSTPQKFSSEFRAIHSSAKLFHLERFTLYGRVRDECIAETFDVNIIWHLNLENRISNVDLMQNYYNIWVINGIIGEVPD